MPKAVPPKDKTAAKRTAALKERLLADGGTRMSLNLDGASLRKLDGWVQAGVGPDRSAVIRKLIADTELPWQRERTRLMSTSNQESERR